MGSKGNSAFLDGTTGFALPVQMHSRSNPLDEGMFQFFDKPLIKPFTSRWGTSKNIANIAV